MKHFVLHITLIFLTLNSLAPVKCEVDIVHVDQEPNFVLKSDGYPLKPGNESIDRLWIFHTSIQLQIEYFELDGQNGDFLMVSDGPFKWPEDYEHNETSVVEPTQDEFIQALLVSNGLLLSWSVNQTINVHAECKESGVFIYFHAESVDETRNKIFKGFDILVKDFDDMRTTPPPVTEEPVVTNPPDTEEIYFSTFLSCMEPFHFLESKNDFKRYVAIMANNYCNSTDCDLTKGPFDETEVNIPDQDGVRYCDPKWSVYNTCVEVRFTIVRFENGEYLMTSRVLKLMWEQESSSVLNGTKYCPYIPPKVVSDINAWVWVAFILGIVLVFSSLLCIVWIKKSNEDYNKQSFKKLKAEDEKDVQPKSFFDQGNPIYAFISGLQKKSNEDEMNMHLGKMVDEAGPVIKKNQLYQHEEYYNRGYEDDDVIQMTTNFTGSPTSNNSTSINRYPKRNLSNMTTIEQADISDTEI